MVGFHTRSVTLKADLASALKGLVSPAGQSKAPAPSWNVGIPKVPPSAAPSHGDTWDDLLGLFAGEEQNFEVNPQVKDSSGVSKPTERGMVPIHKPDNHRSSSPILDPFEPGREPSASFSQNANKQAAFSSQVPRPIAPSGHQSVHQGSSSGSPSKQEGRSSQARLVQTVLFPTIGGSQGASTVLPGSYLGGASPAPNEFRPSRKELADFTTPSQQSPKKRMSLAETPLPKKLRIPGPAGAHQRLLSGEEKQSKQDFSPKLRPAPSDVELSRSPTWLRAIRDYSLSPFGPNTLRFNIQYIYAGGFHQKVAQLLVFVKSCSSSGADFRIVARDPSGEIEGTIERAAVDDHPGLAEGCVLMLQDITVFTPQPNRHYLNIVSGSIQALFPSGNAFAELEEGHNLESLYVLEQPPRGPVKPGTPTPTPQRLTRVTSAGSGPESRSQASQRTRSEASTQASQRPPANTPAQTTVPVTPISAKSSGFTASPAQKTASPISRAPTSAPQSKPTLTPTPTPTLTRTPVHSNRISTETTPNEAAQRISPAPALVPVPRMFAQPKGGTLESRAQLGLGGTPKNAMPIEIGNEALGTNRNAAAQSLQPAPQSTYLALPKENREAPKSVQARFQADQFDAFEDLDALFAQGPGKHVPIQTRAPVTIPHAKQAITPTAITPQAKLTPLPTKFAAQPPAQRTPQSQGTSQRSHASLDEYADILHDL
jgi:hypothetical protein